MSSEDIDLQNALKILSKKLEEESDLMTRMSNFRTTIEAEIQRNYERGIIDNFDKASPEQLRRITDRENRYFKYYTEIYQIIEDCKDPSYFEPVSPEHTPNT